MRLVVVVVIVVVIVVVVETSAIIMQACFEHNRVNQAVYEHKKLGLDDFL